MNEKIYQSRHQRLRHLEWWLVVIIVAGSTIFLGVAFFSLKTFDMFSICFLLLWAVVGIFNSIYFYDLLHVEQLTISPDGISYMNMFGTLWSPWTNAKGIERRIWGTRLTFNSKPQYLKSKRWGWYMQPALWPFARYSQETIPIGHYRWEGFKELQADLKHYAPHLLTDNPTN